MAEVVLKNARLSFSSLWQARAFEEGQEKKFGATLLIPKNSPQIKAIEAAIKATAEEAFKGKAASVLQSIKGDSQKFCYTDGDTKKYDGYEGHMAISAKNPKRPTIVDVDKSPLAESDGKPYDGCYVNAIVGIWAQDNKYGRAIRATLVGVQFSKDGDAFTAARTASADEFDDISDGADAEGGDNAALA